MRKGMMHRKLWFNLLPHSIRSTVGHVNRNLADRGSISIAQKYPTKLEVGERVASVVSKRLNQQLWASTKSLQRSPGSAVVVGRPVKEYLANSIDTTWASSHR